MIERPICHRAEDLVSYLYGEGNEAEAQDFAKHMVQCDACRGEFAILQQAHESILQWRNEALGVMVSDLAKASPPAAATARSDAEIPRGVKRQLPALAAVRQFFRVSPLWLRGATAAGLVVLCALLLFSVSRLRQRRYTQQEVDVQVARQVEKQMDDFKRSQTLPAPAVTNPGKVTVRRPNLADNHAAQRNQPRMARARGLTRHEREQLAADLRLIPGKDEELPFVFSSEQP